MEERRNSLRTDSTRVRSSLIDTGPAYQHGLLVITISSYPSANQHGLLVVDITI